MPPEIIPAAAGPGRNASSAAPARTVPALVALVTIIVITASWWALALWPTDDTAPAWLLRTREVCFGTAETGLPDAGGWMVLTGQPVGMLLVLFAVWGREVREGLRWAATSVAGQLAIGAAAALLLAGTGGVALRLRDAGAEPFASSRTEAIAVHLTRVNHAAQPLSFVDQHGRTVSLETYRGRPVIVTFAYAHCTTVCPTMVYDAISVRDKLPASRVAVLVLTLDPWRDAPSRLATIADQWGLTGDAHVLSGTPDAVERALNAWRVPRVRNERTGDLSHPSLAYIVGVDGRIAYVVSGSRDVMRAAIEAL